METQIVSFQDEATPSPCRLLRKNEVKHKTGMKSDTYLYDLIAKGLFPPAIHPHGGRTAVWPESDVNNYVKSVIETARG